MPLVIFCKIKKMTLKFTGNTNSQVHKVFLKKIATENLQHHSKTYCISGKMEKLKNWTEYSFHKQTNTYIVAYTF